MDEQILHDLSTHMILYEPADLRSLFSYVVDHAKNRFGCHSGAAFVFDGATGSLVLGFADTGTELRLSINPGKGIVGRSCLIRRPVLATGDELSEEDLLPFGAETDKRAALVAAIPIYALGRCLGVFSFCYLNATPDNYQTGEDVLSLVGNTALDKLYQGLSSHQFTMTLMRVRMRDIQRDLLAVGQAPLFMREKVSHFITKLQKAFSDGVLNGIVRLCPELLAVQLIDFPHNTIHTIETFGMPLSLDLSMAHTLDSNDIQAMVVQNCEVEVIAGFDPVRFDAGIFYACKHDRFVRLFMPLFPIPSSWIDTENSGKLDEIITKQITIGEEESDSRKVRRTCRWIDGEVSGSLEELKSLVFGTVEIGYIRNPNEILSLEPWDCELIKWSIARGLELAQDLYPVTLPGSLEQIGRLMAAPMGGDPLIFHCRLPGMPTAETRSYPLSPPWSVAVINRSRGRNLITKKIPPSEDIIFQYSNRQEDGVNRNGELTNDYWEMMVRVNEDAATKSAWTAFKLHESAMERYKFMDSNENFSPPHTLIQHRIVLSLWEQARNEFRATACRFYEIEHSDNGEGSHFGPWPCGAATASVSDNAPVGEEKLIKRVASEHKPN
jgi:hypothetical protein